MLGGVCTVVVLVGEEPLLLALLEHGRICTLPRENGSCRIESMVP